MKDRTLNTSDIAPFELVTEAEKLIPVLESRRPKSSQVCLLKLVVLLKIIHHQMIW